MQSSERSRIAVVQDGVRLNYAVPRVLAQRDRLGAMLTDWWSPPGSWERGLARLIERVDAGLGRRMGARWAEGIPRERVRSCPLLSLRLHASRRKFPSHEAYFAHAADRLARWQARQDLGGARGAFGFVRNVAPVFLEECRRRGLAVVVDQMIAPAEVEAAEALRQSERWPGWEEELGSDHGIVAARERATWALADRITCASRYVRDGLVGCGVDPGRIVVSPYPIDAGRFPFVDRAGRTGPIRVGCIGHVSVRKGAPWFLEVAKRIPPSRATFEWVGPILLRADAAAKVAARVELTGSVPRADVAARLAGFDALLFTTTCEGSAIAVLEAMASGLPIVTTPNSGSLVEDGVEGFVAAYDDTERLVAAVERLAGDAALRLEMGRRGRARVERESEDAFGSRLVAAFDAIG